MGRDFNEEVEETGMEVRKEGEGRRGGVGGEEGEVG